MLCLLDSYIVDIWSELPSERNLVQLVLQFTYAMSI